MFIYVHIYVHMHHLWSYQKGHRLVTLCTHGDFILLPHWGNQATSTMIHYPTRSHYPDTELPTVLLPSAKLGSDNYQFCKSFV